MTTDLKRYCINTTPYQDQNPGTSGLRKKCKTYLQTNYIENFIQSILTYTLETNRDKPITLVVGGDGRYLCDVVGKKIVQMAAANNISKVIIGQNGILSTPAVSTIIRKYSATAGIILTASHNPGGPENDFGMKYNVSNGGSAVDSVTDEISKLSKCIEKYYICSELDVDLTKLGSYNYQVNLTHHSDENKEANLYSNNLTMFEVTVIDSVFDYLELMKSVFNFDMIRNYIKSFDGKFSIKVDCLSGVTGPYILALLNELELDSKFAVNSIPLKDFGGKHPDPNLTYAKNLVDEMRSGHYDIGAAFDGDGDRNMILGKSAFFVTPSDSISIIARYAIKAIPYFSQLPKLKGVARSMPTSAALDVVAKHLDIPLYIVPTGWKYFGNLMDANKLSLCGEESFGTGSDHIREKDGIWAFLAWLSIMAYTQKSVSDLVCEHWKLFGRNYYIRYDYENLESDVGNAVYTKLLSFINNFNKDSVNQNSKIKEGYKIVNACSFEYLDPVDQSLTKNQGLIVTFENSDRFILRKSGTGSTGVTLRLYFDHYSKEYIDSNPHEIMSDLISLSLVLCDIVSITGLSEPTVIT